MLVYRVDSCIIIIRLLIVILLPRYFILNKRMLFQRSNTVDFKFQSSLHHEKWPNFTLFLRFLEQEFFLKMEWLPSNFRSNIEENMEWLSVKLPETSG